jgi:NUMOD3 motif
MNKYEKWYSDITQRGQTRILDSKKEIHHIVPESIGGLDVPENRTILTPREHFICHWLLTKIYLTGPERFPILKALWMMRAENPNQKRYGTKITSRVYANLKEEYAMLQSERVRGENNPMYGNRFHRSEEGKQRQRAAVLGDKNGAKQDQARKKISESKLGKKREPFSEEWRANLSAVRKGENNGMYGKTHSEETRQKISERAKQRTNTPESNEKRAAYHRGKVRPKIQCPHCNQMIAVNTYPRWHGDRCRQSGEKS